jgi:hypothetical protein
MEFVPRMINMQYIPDLKLIFIHIPKTGGTFIESRLQSLNTKIYNTKRIFGGHARYIDFKDKIKDIDVYDIFSIVRNPYDRIISAYNYLKTRVNKGNPLDQKEWLGLKSPSSLTEFINAIYDEYKHNNLHYYIHILQQVCFVRDNDDQIKSKILKYEYLNMDFLKFIEKYKLNIEVYNELSKIYSKIDIKKHYDYNKELSSNDINKINEIYHDDFELFNYTKL